MSARRLARVARVIAATALMASTPAWACAEPVTILQSSGDASNRLDIAILGDGYAAAEQGKFANDVSAFLAAFFAQQPWTEYRTVINAYRIDVVSAQSGASHPERGDFRSTAFSASYNCGGVQRLICVDVSAVNAVVGRSLSASQRDLIIVLVNDVEYGGAGGSVSVASLNSASVEIALHEIGHTLGLLGDEYTTQPPPCTITAEPQFANVTVQTVRSAIKWNAWIDPSTQLPTSGTTSGVPGLYLGAQYCPDGVYRPTYDSKMRSLGRPYEQINMEQLVRRFYNFVAPLDGFSPTLPSVTIPAGSSVTFQVNAPPLATHTDTVRWRLDGTIVAAGSSLQVTAAALPPGTHTLTAEISDATPFVRSDPSGALRASHSWIVTGGSGGGVPNPPTGLTASASGASVMLAWLSPTSGAPPIDYVIEAGSAPGLADLASFSTGTAATVFTASGVGAGRYYIRVRSENGAGRSASSAEVLLIVGTGAAPDPPSTLIASASGSTVTLTWSAPTAGATPTDYVIEAGSAPGLADLASFSTGTATTVFTATGVAAGRYYVRVRSENAAGRSAPSAEALLVVGGGCGGPPTLSSQVAGTTVTLQWTPSAGATSYQLEAGSAAGLNDLANVDTGNAQTTFVATGVAAGTYFVRVRASSACGRTAPSNEVVVSVR
jgi:hypothetical protein